MGPELDVNVCLLRWSKLWRSEICQSCQMDLCMHVLCRFMHVRKVRVANRENKVLIGAVVVIERRRGEHCWVISSRVDNVKCTYSNMRLCNKALLFGLLGLNMHMDSK